ncbi:MAG: FAD-dependent decaprenylphosphoryl-beta-D-ribofuranose 2-oxidase [Chlamydiae bacterium]|nr:FAD-dependent decaprenylphosphoryl-beta-D-ribofuranose 2-oxidase [Chlamydiota bacterium]
MIELKSENKHRQQIDHIQKDVANRKAAIALKRPSSLSNTLRDEKYKQKSERLDISHLNKVLSIDPETQTALVEPRITMQELCKTTLRYGFVPLVVPEFTSITVGGAIMGSALESSSHRYGQFSDCCLEYELILGDGTMVKASPEEKSDLFNGISSSFGSLAMLTLAKIRLMKAKSAVHVTYKRFSDAHSLIEFLKKPCDAEYIEGVMLSEKSGIAIIGTLTDDKPTFRMNRAWSPWYYDRLVDESRESDVIPLQDYLFRWDRAAFWMARYLLSLPLMLQMLSRKDLPSIPEKMRKFAANLTPDRVPSALFRGLFGWTLSSKRLYHLWHSIPNNFAEQIFFVQDFYTPVSKAEEVYNHFQKTTGIFPVMFCSIKRASSPQFLSPHFGDQDFINIGLYGVPLSSRPVPELTAELEREIVAAGGRKMLYAMTYYPEQEFAKIYDDERYRALRKKYYSEKAFVPLYNKVANVL